MESLAAQMIELKFHYSINQDAWIIRLEIPANAIEPNNHGNIHRVVESIAEHVDNLLDQTVEVNGPL